MPPALPRQATCQRWWRCCDVAGTAEPLHGEDDTVSGVDCSVSPRCSRERVADHWLRPLHGDAVAAPNPTAVSDRSAPVSETRRPTVLYAHHDRDSAASMVIVVLVNMNEGGRAVMMDGGPCDLRCCMGDGGRLALQSRLAEEGSKPRQGALAEPGCTAKVCVEREP